MPEHPILDALTEEQLDDLRDGETIKVCVEVREPLFDSDVPSSIDVLEIQLSTQGMIRSPESEEDLVEFFDDVVGVDEALSD